MYFRSVIWELEGIWVWGIKGTLWHQTHKRQKRKEERNKARNEREKWKRCKQSLTDGLHISKVHCDRIVRTHRKHQICCSSLATNRLGNDVRHIFISKCKCWPCWSNKTQFKAVEGFSKEELNLLYTLAWQAHLGVKYLEYSCHFPWTQHVSHGLQSLH